MKDELVALVSHELRTPLTSISGYLELVLEEEDALSEEQRNFLGIVDRNAQRLLSLVSDLLFVAQVQAGRLVLAGELLSMQTLAEEAAAAALPAAAERGVKLAVNCSRDVEIVGDRQHLAQVIDNLLFECGQVHAQGRLGGDPRRVERR